MTTSQAPEQAVGYPLSIEQRRLWLRGAAAEPHVRVLKFMGRCVEDDLRAALTAVVRRHEALRTRFRSAPGLRLPLQEIDPDPDVDWTSAGPEVAPDPGVLGEELAARPMNLDAGASVMARYVQVDDEHSLLAIAVAAARVDAVSLETVTCDLADAIAAQRRGVAYEAHEPVQYADFAGWQESLLGEEGSSWDLGGPVSPGMTLPFTCPGGTPASAEVATKLDLEVIQAIVAAASARGADVSTFIAACWHALGWRFAQPTRLTVGHVLPGRPLDELQRAVGPYAHAVPVCSAPQPDEPFEQLLADVDAAVADVRARQHLYFAEADAGMEWRFEAVPTSPRGDAASNIEVVADRRPVTASTVTLACDDAGALRLLYDPAYLAEPDAHRVLDMLVHCLRSAAADPLTSVDRLALTSRRDQAAILARRTCNPPADPPEATWHEAVERQAARTPDAPAVCIEQRALSYAELVALAGRFASALTRARVTRGDRVGVCVERSPEAVAALLGVLRAGACYVPLDPAYPTPYGNALLADAGADVVVTQRELQSRFEGTGLMVLAIEDAAQGESIASPARASTDDLAYIIYTSGSTGRPKGVMVTHRSVIGLARALRTTVYSDATAVRASLNAPLTFDAAVKQLVLLTMGHSLHVVPRAIRADPTELAAYLERNRVEVLDCTPTQLVPLLEALDEHGSQSYPRRLIIGGEPISQELWNALRAESNRFDAYNVYGPTEATVNATATRLADAGPRPVIGRPLPGAQVLVLDPSLVPLPPGVLGELCVGGFGVAEGYVGEPELTDTAFVPHPAIPGERLFRTGDLGRIAPGGEIEFVGRRDRQVKVAGYRIEPAEIEAALARHPAVREVVVAAVTAGSTARRLCAYVVPATGTGKVAHELRAHAEAELPEHMRPTMYALLDELPATEHGKIDFEQLADISERADGTRHVTPRTPTEAALVEVWRDLLGIEEIGVHDDFFQLGGDSILQVQAVALGRQCGLQLEPRDYHRHATIAELAAIADGRPDGRVSEPRFRSDRRRFAGRDEVVPRSVSNGPSAS